MLLARRRTSSPWTAAARRGQREGGPVTDSRLRSVATIAIFYVAIPLGAYFALRAAGLTSVTALLLSGIFPVLGIVIGLVRNHRLDVVGVLVLAGIVAGTIMGLISHSARPLLLEGCVPTAVFGVACLGSLWLGRPLMFGLALEFAGPDSGRGLEMTSLWEHAEFRRIFRVITAVWGAGFLVEAGLKIVIVYTTSTGTALASSMATPFLFAGILSAWTVAYGAQQKRKGARLAAAAAPGEVREPSVTSER
jgi:hypothetical protein